MCNVGMKAVELVYYIYYIDYIYYMYIVPQIDDMYSVL